MMNLANMLFKGEELEIGSEYQVEKLRPLIKEALIPRPEDICAPLWGKWFFEKFYENWIDLSEIELEYCN